MPLATPQRCPVSQRSLGHTYEANCGLARSSSWISRISLERDRELSTVGVARASAARSTQSQSARRCECVIASMPA
eukprot:5291133-Prymnesium_polylepis.1